MIFINKQTDNPDISVYKSKRWKGLDGKKTTLAARDLEKSIKYFGDPANFNNNKKLTSKSFKYQAYSHPHTKKELNKIFNSKCAYCESFIMHIEPGDIEHFRPKAEIHTHDGSVLIPGYYWLGADWKNLLLSCIKCNRSNKQSINIEDGVVKNMGKANHFPLSDENKRLRKHTDNITREDDFVLILNPCSEHPKDHLTFEDNGQVTPLDAKGEASIEVYGLYRADLVLRRSRVSKELDSTLFSLVEVVKFLKVLVNDNNNLPLDNILSIIEIQKEKLQTSFHKEAEYLALKRQKLNRFISNNPISYNNLKNIGIDLDVLIE